MGRWLDAQYFALFDTYLSLVAPLDTSHARSKSLFVALFIADAVSQVRREKEVGKRPRLSNLLIASFVAPSANSVATVSSYTIRHRSKIVSTTWLIQLTSIWSRDLRFKSEAKRKVSFCTLSSSMPSNQPILFARHMFFEEVQCDWGIWEEQGSRYD